MINKYKLMRELQELEFDELDLTLYLNNYSNCKQTDDNELTKAFSEKNRMYEISDTPTAYFGCTPSKYPWEWLKQLWPWEYEEDSF